MEIISRQDAAVNALTHYFTGKPCGNGHLAKRYTSTGNCVECHRDRVSRERRKLLDRRPNVVIVKNLVLPKKWLPEIMGVVKMYLELEGMTAEHDPEFVIRPEPRSLTVEEVRALRPTLGIPQP